jgi:hypothetical protein
MEEASSGEGEVVGERTVSREVTEELVAGAVAVGMETLHHLEGVQHLILV